MIFYKKNFIFLLIFSFSWTQLHHSAIGASSGTYEIKGLAISQSVGQISPIGNYQNNRINLFQGFQQPLKLLKEEYIPVIKGIMAFPNPFTSDLNFGFENINTKEIKVDIYDVNGRHIKTYYADDFGEILKLKLENLTATEYIFRLTGPNINYSTKIIKK